jgi:hypothetical protein
MKAGGGRGERTWTLYDVPSRPTEEEQIQMVPATSAATATQSRARRSDASPPGPCAVHRNQPRSAAETKPPEQKSEGKNRPGLGGSPPEASGGLTCALGSRGVRVCALGLGGAGARPGWGLRSGERAGAGRECARPFQLIHYKSDQPGCQSDRTRVC